MDFPNRPEIKPARISASRLCPLYLGELLPLCVSLVELVNATCCVDELHLTCVEWVRCVRDFELYNRISNSIDFDSLLCVCA